MRIGSAVLFLALSGAVMTARADVIFSGYVQAMSTTGSPCGAGGTGYGSLSVGCATGDSLGIGTVQGSGDAYSGSLYVNAVQNGGSFGPADVRVTADGSLDLNQTYVLVGGLGTATVNFGLSAFDPGGLYFAYASPCSFTFNGVSQSCETELLGGGVISEQVEYWVPFSIGLDVTLYTVAQTASGAGQFGTVDYSFKEPGLIALPTPEPSSILLLLPALAGTVFAAKSRCRA